MDIESDDGEAPHLQFLSSRSIALLAEGKPDLLFVNTKTSIEETMSLLSSNDILSVPVWEESRKSFVGVVDVYDIMAYIVFTDSVTEGSFRGGGTFPMALLEKQFEMGGSLKEPVSRLLALSSLSSGSRAIRTFRSDHTLLDVVVAMSQSIRRILVQSSWMKYDKMISQADLVVYLYAHFPLLGAVPDLTVQELSLTKRVVTIETTVSAMEGYYRMATEKIPCVAVVAPVTGVVEATLSVSNLRGLSALTLSWLRLPVREFLRREAKGKLRPPITIPTNGLLRDVVKLVCDHRVHRVWVVNEFIQPIGVVTLTDIISCFKE